MYYQEVAKDAKKRYDEKLDMLGNTVDHPYIMMSDAPVCGQ